jgi:outer membrane murein-binding lipoprotein Lpp
MAGKSVEQRINDTETRIRQLEAQKRLLAQQLKQQARKDRTRRLIQIGAIMDRLGMDTPAKAQAFQALVQDNAELKAWFAELMATVDTPTEE